MDSFIVGSVKINQLVICSKHHFEGMGSFASIVHAAH